MGAFRRGNGAVDGARDPVAEATGQAEPDERETSEQATSIADTAGSRLKDAGERIASAVGAVGSRLGTVGSGIHDVGEEVAAAADGLGERLSTATEDFGGQLHRVRKRARRRVRRAARRGRRQATELERRMPVRGRALRRGVLVLGIVTFSAGVARTIARRRSGSK